MSVVAPTSRSPSSPPLFIRHRPARPVSMDEEEQQWAKELGDGEFLLKDIGETGYIEVEGEIYAFNISSFHFPNGCLSEEGRRHVRSVVEEKIHHLNRCIDPFFDRTSTERIDFNFSRRQLKSFFQKKKFNYLTGFVRHSQHETKYQKLRDVIEELKATDQLLLNELFKDCRVSTFYTNRSFNRVLSHNGDLGSILLPYITHEEKEVAAIAMEFAVFMNLPKYVHEILRRHPDLIQNSSLLFSAVRLSSITVALLLICKGIAINHEGVSPFLVLLPLVRETQTFTAEGKELLLLFTQLLLDKGALLDHTYDVALIGETALTLVEENYFYRGPNRDLVQEICILLIRRGAAMTHRMALDIKLRLQENREYLPYLKAQHLISDEEERIFNSEKGKVRDESELAREALIANLFLENHSLIPIDTIVRIRRLKKEIKRQHSDQYTRLKQNFRNLIARHPLLRELSEIRKQDLIRTQPTYRLIRLYALFMAENKYDTLHCRENAKVLLSPDRKIYWNQLVERVFAAAKIIEEDDFLTKHFIVWLHGTKSSTLPVLLKTGALYPLGKILQEGFAPLCGEIFSEGKVNQDHISGEKFSWNFSEDYYYFDAATRFLVTLLYALRKNSVYSNEMDFDPTKTAARLTESFLEEIIQNKAHINAWTVIRVDILRLKMTDKEAEQKLVKFKEAVQVRLNRGNPHREKLETLMKDLDVQVPHILSSEELEQIRDSYPIVFGSTTVETVPIPSVIRLQEFDVQGSAQLGTDVQVAFTLSEKVEELKKLLSRFGMHVYPLSVASYLEFMQMARGSLHLEWEKLRVEQHIGKTLQHDILPAYVTPFPEKGTYENHEGKTEPLRNPFYGHGISSYAEYRKLVEEGRILPRTIHGPMHATRTAIWTQLLASLYDYKERYLIAIAGAAHDWRREDEGVDRWDLASAQALRGYLLARGYLANEIDRFVKAIAEKDPKEKCTTPEQIMIHNADVLDIMRCVHDFRKSELVGPPISDEIIEEVRLFIQITENPELKAYLEHHSEDCFGDLLRIMKAVHDKRRCFPHLMKHLTIETPLDPKYLEILTRIS